VEIRIEKQEKVEAGRLLVVVAARLSVAATAEKISQQ